jgi:hypothetical protein
MEAIAVSKVIHIDLDGCIIQHTPNNASSQWTDERELLPGVVEAFNAWERNGYMIILETCRKECHREETEAWLKKHGLFWDKLIMGLWPGERILINDIKEACRGKSATAYEIPRNGGLKSLINL